MTHMDQRRASDINHCTKFHMNHDIYKHLLISKRKREMTIELKNMPLNQMLFGITIFSSNLVIIFRIYIGIYIIYNYVLELVALRLRHTEVVIQRKEKLNTGAEYKVILSMAVAYARLTYNLAETGFSFHAHTHFRYVGKYIVNGTITPIFAI